MEGGRFSLLRADAVPLGNRRDGNLPSQGGTKTVRSPECTSKERGGGLSG